MENQCTAINYYLNINYYETSLIRRYLVWMPLFDEMRPFVRQPQSNGSFQHFPVGTYHVFLITIQAFAEITDGISWKCNFWVQRTEGAVQTNQMNSVTNERSKKTTAWSHAADARLKAYVTRNLRFLLTKSGENGYKIINSIWLKQIFDYVSYHDYHVILVSCLRMWTSSNVTPKTFVRINCTKRYRNFCAS